MLDLGFFFLTICGQRAFAKIQNVNVCAGLQSY